MIKNRELFNPVLPDEQMPVDKFLKYVDIRERQGDCPTKKSIVDEILNVFIDTYRGRLHPDTIKEYLDFIRPRIEKNAGLAQFIIDYEAAKSDFFFPWLKAVFTSPSEALEMSYGYGKNLRGNYHYANYDHRMYYFVKNDPTFVFNRERQLYVANCARATIDARAFGGIAKIVDLGAGRMNWLRRHGLSANRFLAKIWAFDHDDSIVPGELFEAPLNSLGIKYEKKDIMDALQSGECTDTSLFILQGVASYYPLEAFRNRILLPVYNQLHVGGAFFFDLQLDCPYYRRSMTIFDWPAMKLYKSPTIAFDTIEKMLRELRKEGVHMTAEYAMDSYNEIPSSIMITLSKC